MKKLPPLLVKRLHRPVGEAASPLTSLLLQPIQVTNPSNPKMSKVEKTGDRKKETPGRRKKDGNHEGEPPPRGGAAPMAHAEDVDAWLEANMPASPMISFAEAVLRHYKKLKLWWQPDVSDGWHCRTKIATAAKYYINNPDTWHQLRDDLRDKILRGGATPGR